MKQQGMNIKEEELEFSDPKEEIAYWKQLAEKNYQKLLETRDELDEFQEGSRELEAELEAQLEQSEQRQRELLTVKARLENENENLKQKIEESQNEAYLTITALQDEVAQLKAVKEELQKYVRELEQTNDDLERAKRATMCSLEDFEQRLNQAIERNAILENELDEKETLAVTVQRLKDEARDLRQELAVKSQEKEKEKELKRQEKEKENREKENEKEKNDIEENKENKLPPKSEPKTQTEIATSPITIKQEPLSPHEKIAMMNSIGTSPLHQPNGLGGSPLTPSARISALNIVGDLLRKVGALESKLASCRNFVKEQPRGLGPGPGLSLMDSPRPRKSNKTTPSQGMQSLVKVVV